jgi:hypothetical protein
MTLHSALLFEMLDAEIEVTRQRLQGRVADIRRTWHVIQVPLRAANDQPVWLTLSGEKYDSDPFSVSVVDAEGRAGAELWPPSLLGGLHPVTGQPFVCVQGCAEYYTHPSHFRDRWDAVRSRLRLPDLLDHLLRRAGVP